MLGVAKLIRAELLRKHLGTLFGREGRGIALVLPCIHGVEMTSADTWSSLGSIRRQFKRILADH
jgi:hypothetical protein